MKCKKLDPDAIIPTVAHVGSDHGYDLYALEPAVIAPGEYKAIKTGIAIEFSPAAGARVANRSSMGKKGAVVMGGEIDSGYRGDIIVMLRNLNQPVYRVVQAGVTALLEDCTPPERFIVVMKGERIAQLVKEPSIIRWGDLPDEVEELSDSARGSSGFGSSGK